MLPNRISRPMKMITVKATAGSRSGRRQGDAVSGGNPTTVLTDERFE